MTRARLACGGQELQELDLPPDSGPPESSERELTDAFAFLPGVLYRCSADPDRSLAAIGGSVAEFTGRDGTALTPGLSWSDLIHPDDRRAAWDQIASAMRVGRPYAVEYRLRAPDGSERWVLDRGRAEPGESEGSCVLIGALTEVTGIRLLEQQAARGNAISRLAAGVAHDINNLQAVITGCAQLLGRVIPAGARERETLAEITDAARRAAILARHLVAFTRPGTTEAVPLDVNQLILGMERLLRSLLGSEIGLTIELEAGVGTVSVESSEMEQILLNLVANAREAMPQGGAVTISTRELELGRDPRVPSPGSASGVHVCLRVADTGTGIPAEALLHVFEPYFSTKQSSGLGLSIVEAIVRRQGGQVQVRSELGAGTVFDVLLPRSDQCRTVSKVVSRPPPEQP